MGRGPRNEDCAVEGPSPESRQRLTYMVCCRTEFLLLGVQPAQGGKRPWDSVAA